MDLNKKFIDRHHAGILDFLRGTPRQPQKESQIAAHLGLRAGGRKRLRLLLNVMARQGEIVCLRNDLFALGTAADLVTGSLEVSRSGDGWLTPADGSPDVFVAREHLATALPRDRVVVRLDAAGRSDLAEQRRSGRVIKILDRSPRALCGTLKATRNFFYVQPLDPGYRQNFYVADLKGAREGDRVVIQFVEWPDRRVNPEAEILEVLGPAADPSLDTLAVIRHYGLQQNFPEIVLQEAAQAPARLEQIEMERRDISDLPVFTIDPATARDFDDALSLAVDGENRRVLGVHIADVSHFVPPDSALDSEARRRGNSVYFPDLVLPMLPEQLSNGLCSLRPDEKRLAFSVLITFDVQGRPIKSEFLRSVIRSRLRLTYEQALSVLNGHQVEGVSADMVALLRDVHRLAQQMRARRLAQLALDLDVPEYEVIIGRDGLITDIRQHGSDISHQLIEECMIAANEAVDRELSNKGYNLLRRVHPPPKPQKLEMLTAQLIALGFQPGDLSKRRNLTDFLEDVRAHPLANDVKLMVLKSMQRAVYAPEAKGHFGLAKKYYAHFTSPIRRYPDLVAHRVLAACLTGRRGPYEPANLKALGEHCSETEEIADAAEKTVLEIKKYRFLEQQLRQNKLEVYDAVITRVVNFGMFVELTRLQLSGLVRVSSISSEFVRYDRQREVLRAGRITYQVGTRVRVRVTRVDFDKREIDFILAESTAKNNLLKHHARRKHAHGKTSRR